MDETPLTFDCPANRTVDQVSAKTVSVLTIGHEKYPLQVLWLILLMGIN